MSPSHMYQMWRRVGVYELLRELKRAGAPNKDPGPGRIDTLAHPFSPQFAPALRYKRVGYIDFDLTHDVGNIVGTQLVDGLSSLPAATVGQVDASLLSQQFVSKRVSGTVDFGDQRPRLWVKACLQLISQERQ